MTINILYVILDTLFTTAITFYFGIFLANGSYSKDPKWQQILFPIAVIVCIISNIIQIVWLGQGKDIKATMFDIYFYSIGCLLELVLIILLIVHKFKPLKKDKTN